MGKVAKICSVKRNYADDYSLEGSLHKNGYNRFPGTGIRLVPYRETSNGSFRTGLDPNALYINKMSQAEQEIERARVTALKEELEKLSGLDLSPYSDYYTKMYDADYGENNRAQVKKLIDGDNIFNLSNIVDAITFAWLRVHPQIAPSYETYKSGKAGNVQFYVSDPDVENEIIFQEKTLINKAIVELDNLSPTKRKTVARLLALPISDESKDVQVYNLIDSFIKEGTIKGGEFKGQKSVKLFMDIVKMKDDNLYIKDLIKQAFDHSIYRRKENRIWEGQVEIAKDEKQLFERLLTPKYQEDLLALEEKIKSKKSILA